MLKFVTYREYETLKKRTDERLNEISKILDNMTLHLVNMQQELNELKKPKKSNYFG